MLLRGLRFSHLSNDCFRTNAFLVIQKRLVNIAGHLDVDIFKHEGIDRVNVDGQVLTVYEYRPVANAPHKLVVKYGNLFFTVGRTSPAANGAETPSHNPSAPQSEAIEDLVQQLQAAQLRMDALSRVTSDVSAKSIEKLKAIFKSVIERERTESALRLQRLEETLLESLKTLQNTSQQAPTAAATPAPPLPSRSPQPTAQAPAPPRQEDWYIAPEQRLVYESIFDQHDTPRAGVLSGGQVKDILSRSKLPNETLAQIWNLASLNKEGALNKAEFCIAMYATTKAVQGGPLPQVAPHSLVASAGYMPGEEIHDEPDDEPAQRKPKKKKKEAK